MIAEPDDVLHHLRFPNVLRVAGRVLIANRKILPDHDAHFVAEVVEIVGFQQAPAPDANQLNAHVFGRLQRPAVAFAGQIEQHILGGEVHAFHKQLFTVDHKLPVFPAILIARPGRSNPFNGSDTGCKRQLVNNLSVLFER